MRGTGLAGVGGDEGVELLALRASQLGLLGRLFLRLFLFRLFLLLGLFLALLFLVLVASAPAKGYLLG